MITNQEKIGSIQQRREQFNGTRTGMNLIHFFSSSKLDYAI